MDNRPVLEKKTGANPARFKLEGELSPDRYGNVYTRCEGNAVVVFFIARGVVVSGQRRLELAELCEIAHELNLQVHPDNLIEDRKDATDVCPGLVLVNSR